MAIVTATIAPAQAQPGTILDLLVPAREDERATGGRPFGPREFQPGKHPPRESSFETRTTTSLERVLRGRESSPATFLLERETSTVAMTLPSRDREQDLGAALRSRSLTARWVNAETLGFELVERAEAVELRARRSPGPIAIEAAVNGVVAEDRHRAGGHVTIGARAGRWTQVQAGLFSTPLLLTARLMDAETQYAFPLDLASDGTEVGTSMQLAGGVTAGGRFRAGRTSTFSAQNGIDDYLMRPDIDWRDFRAALVKHGDRFSGGLRLSRGSFDGRADGYHHGLRFARIFALDAGYSRLTAGAEARLGRHLAAFDIERLTVRGESRGDVQSWPFTPTVVDLFGARMFYRGTARIVVERVHLGGALGMSRATSLQAGVNYLDAHVDVTGERWNPEFLVFGRKNVRQGALALDRFRGLLLSGGFEARVGPLHLAADAVQLVPLSRHMRARAGGDMDEPGSGVTGGPGARKLDGGRVVSLRACWRPRMKGA